MSPILLNTVVSSLKKKKKNIVPHWRRYNEKMFIRIKVSKKSRQKLLSMQQYFK